MSYSRPLSVIGGLNIHFGKRGFRFDHAPAPGGRAAIGDVLQDDFFDFILAETIVEAGLDVQAKFFLAPERHHNRQHHARAGLKLEAGPVPDRAPHFSEHVILYLTVKVVSTGARRLGTCFTQHLSPHLQSRRLAFIIGHRRFSLVD
jgi:hypothetical protein